MGAGVRMLRAHLRLGMGVGFHGPLAQHFLAELTQLRAHSLLGAMGVAAVGDGLVQVIGQCVQAGQQRGPLRQTFFERATRDRRPVRQGAFIIHEHFSYTS